MVYFTDTELESMVAEDVPSLDLTTSLLGIEGRKGKIRFVSRGLTIAACTEEASRICSMNGLTTTSPIPTGYAVKPGSILLEAEGDSAAIHRVWKACINILEWSCGVAERARNYSGAAKQENPHIAVVSTRKHIPGVKKLLIKAAMAGGIMPHRLGLSETVLVFAEHADFLGGYPQMIQKLRSVRNEYLEKTVTVEVHNPDDALLCAESGMVDIIQMDKFAPAILKETLREVKSISPHIRLAASGGITQENVRCYAGTGINIIVTSSIYYGKPADIGAEIGRIYESDTGNH